MSNNSKLVFGIVGLLIVVVIIILVAIILVLKGSEGGSSLGGWAAGGKPQVVEPEFTGKTKIFVTKQRIEENMLIDPDSMLRLELRDIAEVKSNMFQESQRPTLINKYYAKMMINADTPLLEDYITTEMPVSRMQIPAGYRAITITVDARKGVEGWARPNSRVDILLTYKDESGKTKVATIVRFVRILSVAGQLGDGGGQRMQIGKDTNITLLVEERDAKKIELARSYGEISLSLVGNDPVGAPTEPESPVTPEELFGGQKASTEELSPPDGRMTVKDPRTGEIVLYELRKGKWSRVAD
ncbi:MAG: Flp pilus assembly protein CpaB [Deltaproteobacteria bacterium]|nr:Flp pilus assembly protein CpaB [Deltaproteobacteria bacterium]